MARRTVSPIRYVLGMTIMLVSLAAFLVVFVWFWMDVPAEEFLAIVTEETATYLEGVPTTTISLGAVLLLLVVVTWRLFGFGSMEP